jgi:hypothetical protein
VPEDHIATVLAIIDKALKDINTGAYLLTVDRVNDLLLDVRAELKLYEEFSEFEDDFQERITRVKKWLDKL